MDVQSQLSHTVNESRNAGCILHWFQTENWFQTSLKECSEKDGLNSPVSQIKPAFNE